MVSYWYRQLHARIGRRARVQHHPHPGIRCDGDPTAAALTICAAASAASISALTACRAALATLASVSAVLSTITTRTALTAAAAEAAAASPMPAPAPAHAVSTQISSVIGARRSATHPRAPPVRCLLVLRNGAPAALAGATIQFTALACATTLMDDLSWQRPAFAFTTTGLLATATLARATHICKSGLPSLRVGAPRGLSRRCVGDDLR